MNLGSRWNTRTAISDQVAGTPEKSSIHRHWPIGPAFAERAAEVSPIPGAHRTCSRLKERTQPCSSHQHIALASPIPPLVGSFADLDTPALRATLEPIVVPVSRVSNWAGAFSSTPRKVYEPTTYDQCAQIFELASRDGASVRPIGVVHSPSDLALTKDYMLRTLRLNHVLEVNADKRFVIVQGGITLSDLHDRLSKHGLCLRNCGSISEQTLAGVVATATHGSGLTFGVLSTHVLAMDLMLPDGSIIHCSRDENMELFMASLCGLGATGLILSVKIEVEPTFRLKEYQQTVSFETAVQRLPELAPSAEHVRMWWFPQADSVRLSMFNRTNEPLSPAGNWLWDSLMSYHVVQFLLFIGRFIPTINTWTARFAAWLVSQPSVGVNDGLKIFNVDCRYQQYTTEWSIPYENTQACLRDLRSMYENELADPHGLRPHFPIEIRFTDADDIWLSPSFNHRSTWIGVIQYKPYGYAVPYRKLFAQFEQVVLRYGGRPHWAKAHPLRPMELRSLYPRFDDFVRVLTQVDPRGVLRNPYIDRHIFGAAGPAAAARIFKTR